MKKGEHSWTKNDMILALYYTVYGLKDIGFDEYEYAEIRIGASVRSLRLQAANIRQYYKDQGYDQDFDNKYLLSDHYKLQRDVVDEYKDIPQYDFQELVEGILTILSPNISQNRKTAEERRIENDRKEEIRKMILKLQKERDDAKTELGNIKMSVAGMYRVGLDKQANKAIESALDRFNLAELNLTEYFKKLEEEEDKYKTLV